MPSLIPVDHDPFADAQDGTQGYASVPPPQRLSPDTMRAFGIDVMMNGGKGAASILTQDAGSQYQKKRANVQAENQANLEYKQALTKPLLDRIQDFRNIGTKAGPDVLQKATGPNYGGDGGLSSYVLPDTSSQSYQALRAASQHMNPLSDQGSYDKARDANLEMHHLKDAIGSAVKALPGSKGPTTDQDQALVLDMVGKALNASNPETFYKILHDAENTLRGRSGLAARPDQDSYLPKEWSKTHDIGDGFTMEVH